MRQRGSRDAETRQHGHGQSRRVGTYTTQRKQRWRTIITRSTRFSPKIKYVTLTEADSTANSISQKVQCTFKTDVPDLGYLDGGSDRDVRTSALIQIPLSDIVQIKALSKVQLPFWLTPMLLMSFVTPSTIPPRERFDQQNPHSDFADCAVPPPFNQRVRNALNADPKSVKLSGLVGSGGPWYAFGKMIAGM